MFDGRQVLLSEATVTQESNNERQRQTFAVPFKLRSLEAQEAADLLLRLADGDPVRSLSDVLGIISCIHDWLFKHLNIVET